MRNSALTRRELLAGLGGLSGVMLAGCGSSPTLDLIGQGFSSAAKPQNTYPLSAERIRALPYASLGVRVGSSAPGVMILANYDGDSLDWASADRVILVTRQGRITKTVGLARDLSGTQWTGEDPVLALARGGGSVLDARVNRFVDLRSPDDFGVAIESSVRLAGAERITILDTSYDTVLVVERVKAPKWRWSTENRFWVERDSGRIVRSQQRYCPEVETLTLEVLKPAVESMVRG